MEYNSLGAEVYLDDVYIGMIGQPLETYSSPSVSGTSHTLKIKKAGYRDFVIDFEARKGISPSEDWVTPILESFNFQIYLEPKQQSTALTPLLLLGGFGALMVLGYYSKR